MNYDSELNNSPKSEIRRLKYKSDLSSLDNSFTPEEIYPNNSVTNFQQKNKLLNQTYSNNLNSQNIYLNNTNRFNQTSISNNNQMKLLSKGEDKLNINSTDVNSQQHFRSMTQRTSPLRSSKNKNVDNYTTSKLNTVSRPLNSNNQYNNNNNQSYFTQYNLNKGFPGVSKTEINSSQISSRERERQAKKRQLNFNYSKSSLGRNLSNFSNNSYGNYKLNSSNEFQRSSSKQRKVEGGNKNNTNNMNIISTLNFDYSRGIPMKTPQSKDYF